MCQCTPEIKTPFCGRGSCLAPPPKPSTYVDDDGNEKPERRRRDRDNDDPRIAHLFSGFNSRIESAEMNGDLYAAGYLRAMRLEFGQLLQALVR